MTHDSWIVKLYLIAGLTSSMTKPKKTFYECKAVTFVTDPYLINEFINTIIHMKTVGKELEDTDNNIQDSAEHLKDYDFADLWLANDSIP